MYMLLSTCLLLTTLLCSRAAPVFPSSSSGTSRRSSSMPSSSSEKPVMLFGVRIDKSPSPKRARVEIQQERQQQEAGSSKEVVPSLMLKEHASLPVIFKYHVTDAILGRPIKYDGSRHPIHPLDHHPVNLESTLHKIHQDSFLKNTNRYHLQTHNAKILTKAHQLTMEREGGIVDQNRQLIYHYPVMNRKLAFEKAHKGQYHRLMQSNGFYRIADPLHKVDSDTFHVASDDPAASNRRLISPSNDQKDFISIESSSSSPSSSSLSDAFPSKSVLDSIAVRSRVESLRENNPTSTSNDATSQSKYKRRD